MSVPERKSTARAKQITILSNCTKVLKSSLAANRLLLWWRDEFFGQVSAGAKEVLLHLFDQKCWASGFQGWRRYSFSSILECSATSSMRPRSRFHRFLAELVLKGGSSRPGSSRPSLGHITILGMKNIVQEKRANALF